MILFTQCKSSQSVFKKKVNVPFSVEELNILVAAAYVKHHQKGCVNIACEYLINSKFTFFNPDFLRCEPIRSEFNQLGYSITDKIEIKGVHYNEVNVGELIFNDFEDSSQFTFSPAIYLPKYQLIVGQVIEKDNKYTMFTCKLIGNRIFWSENNTKVFCPKFIK